MDDYKPFENEFFQDDWGIRIWERRHAKICQTLDKWKVKSVCDIGCNDGKLLQKLKRSLTLEHIIGLDIDENILQNEAVSRCRIDIEDKINAKERTSPLKIEIFCGDILRECKELKERQVDALVLVELIEHIDINSLPLLEKNLFNELRARIIVITTPNYDFNSFFHPGQPSPPFRHPDHRFEMTQKEFESWSKRVSELYGYEYEIDGIGVHKSKDMSRGYCSQMVVFNRISQRRKKSQMQIDIKLEQQQLVKLFEETIGCLKFEEKLVEALRRCYYAECIGKKKVCKNDNTNDEESQESTKFVDDFIEKYYKEPGTEYIELSSLVKKDAKLKSLLGESDLGSWIKRVKDLDPELDFKQSPLRIKYGRADEVAVSEIRE